MADVGSQRGAHPIVVSPELQQVLREYTKAVMRDRPEDVLSYSRDWFIEKTHEQRIGEYELPESNSDKYNALSGELKRKIAVSFKRYDVNCDRAINSLELRQLLRGAGKLFGFENEVWDFPCGSPLA
uniref:EF-hand domain-containing protein n=1 Tax=Chrysotila carterae TaxID=13221 RepID=A0A7S4EUS6_CHRCT